MKKRLLIGIAAAILAVSGCQGGTTTVSTTAAEETTAETTEAPTLPAWTEEDETDLYNAHVDLFNRTMSAIDRALSRYFDYVEFQEEFVRTGNDYYTYSFDDFEFGKLEAINNLLEYKSEPSTLDNAFKELETPMTELMNVLNDIYEYTDMKSYLDDDYAKGAEQHAELWAKLNAYDEVVGIYNEALTIEADARQLESLEQLKEDGYEALYALNLTLMSAQAIQNELYAQGINDDNILEMDLTVIEPMYEEFIQNVDLVLSYDDNDEQLEEEGLTRRVGKMDWTRFVMSMKDTRTSMTKVMDKVRNQEPLTQSDRIIDSAGNCSLAAYENGIGDMISNYNNLIR